MSVLSAVVFVLLFSWLKSSFVDKNVGDNKKSGTLGKLFRNIGIRRSGRKQGFKQHEGDYIALLSCSFKKENIASAMWSLSSCLSLVK